MLVSGDQVVSLDSSDVVAEILGFAISRSRRGSLETNVELSVLARARLDKGLPVVVVEGLL